MSPPRRPPPEHPPDVTPNELDERRGLRLDVEVSIGAECAGCRRAVEMPEAGRRFPVQTTDGVVVNGDGPCPACGSARVRVRIRI